MEYKLICEIEKENKEPIKLIIGHYNNWSDANNRLKVEYLSHVWYGDKYPDLDKEFRQSYELNDNDAYVEDLDEHCTWSWEIVEER